MATYFVFSDVHGFYNELMQALNKEGFDINNKNHYIISCGDLLDRGPQANECIDFANKMHAEGRAILIKGNHEDLMEQAICRHYFGDHDYHNKTNDSCYQLTGLYPDTASEENILNAMKVNIKWNTYINSCIDYFETDNYIFTHGWIPCFDKWGATYYNMDWRNASKEDWEQARWLNGFEAWEHGIREDNKIIVCGHWGTDYGHKYLHNEQTLYSREDIWLIRDFAPAQFEEISKNSHRIFEDNGIIGLDASTVISGFVNCKKLSKQKKIII